MKFTVSCGSCKEIKRGRRYTLINIEAKGKRKKALDADMRRLKLKIKTKKEARRVTI